MYVVDDIQNFINENEEDLRKSLKNNSEAVSGIVSSKIEYIFFSGQWLGETLKKDGASEDEVLDTCFALGQRSMYGNPFDIALKYANEYLENGFVSEKPGDDLAFKIQRENNSNN